MRSRLSADARARKNHFENTVSPREGGDPALDFVNTLRNRGSDKPKDYLTNYDDFLYWCRDAGVIDMGHCNGLSEEAYCYHREAAAVFADVINARFMLYHIFTAIIRREPADEIFVKAFNDMLARGQKFLRFESVPGSMARMWVGVAEELNAPLYMVVQSAADLIMLTETAKIKQCKTCQCLFYDRTKNGIRRWCNQRGCGHLLRAKRHYQAKKEQQAAEIALMKLQTAI